MKLAATKLKAWRLLQSLSQTEAADRIGVSQAAWSDWESALKKPGIDEAALLSDLTKDSQQHIHVTDWRETDPERKARMRRAKKRTRRAS